MSPGGPANEGREIARVLTSALATATAPGATRESVALAREIAQMLSLEGLDRVLRLAEEHAGGPWPTELAIVLERLGRLSAATEEAGSHAPFTRADLELAGLAAEIEALEWTPAPAGDPGPPLNTMSLGVATEGYALATDGERDLRRVRLTSAVGAALRAALDWLHGGEKPRRPLHASVEDSMFEVWAGEIDPAGLRPAGDVLASVGGSLGPVGVPASPGTWRVRVPAYAARECYLMVVQGGVGLALPWHSVIHVHLLPEAEVDDAQPAAPRLASLAPLAETAGERPVVMLAHGLKRAWLVADRLVWRFPAERCEPVGEPPAAALDGQVRTDEGESWWRVDVGRLLETVEPMPVPSAAPAPPAAPRPASAPPAGAPVPSSPRATRAWTPRTPPAPGPLPPPRVELIAPEPAGPEPSAPKPRPALRLLERAEVEPLPVPAPPALGAGDVEPLAAPEGKPPAPVAAPPERARDAATDESPAHEAPEEPEELTEPPADEAPADDRGRPFERPRTPERTPRPRRVLLAEDSLMAQLFLVRMFQHRGFFVEAVASAAALAAALRRGPWGLVCVDVELPDGRGAALLDGVREQLDRTSPEADLVALVRDAEDMAAARAAGVSRTLRKPYAEDELDALLARLRMEQRR